MKLFMKKLFLLLISAVTLFFSCSSSDNSSDDKLKKIAVQIVLNNRIPILNCNGYLASAGEIIPVEFDINFADYITRSNTSYSNSVARFASLFAADAYDSAALSVTNLFGNSDLKNNTIMLEKFGFSDVKNINLSDESFEVDPDDLTSYVIGHREFSVAGTDYSVVFLAVRGTNGTHSEWYSNFDVGLDSAEYYDKTGAHPYWTHKEIHKGFDVAANRVKEKVDSYLKEFVPEKNTKSIFITGHSRGGSIANILGKMFEDDANYKSYTYTFASQNVTTDKNAGNYKTIYNILNTDDILTALPAAKWGFTRYGKIVGETLTRYVIDYKGIIGREYVKSIEDIKSAKEYLLLGFEGLDSSRNELYTIKTDSTVVMKKSLVEVYKKFLKVVDESSYAAKTEDDSVECYFCSGFSMNFLADVISGGASSSGLLSQISLPGQFNALKVSLLNSVANGYLQVAHEQKSYYVLVSSLNFFIQ